jgi:hypothetical protein
VEIFKKLLKSLYKTKPELIEEHRRLVEILRHGSKSEQKKEAAKQLKELKQMIKGDSEEDKANEKKMKEKYKTFIEKPKTPEQEENEVRARYGMKPLKKAVYDPQNSKKIMPDSVAEERNPNIGQNKNPIPTGATLKPEEIQRRRLADSIKVKEDKVKEEKVGQSGPMKSAASDIKDNHYKLENLVSNADISDHDAHDQAMNMLYDTHNALKEANSSRSKDDQYSKRGLAISDMDLSHLDHDAWNTEDPEVSHVLGLIDTERYRHRQKFGYDPTLSGEFDPKNPSQLVEHIKYELKDKDRTTDKNAKQFRTKAEKDAAISSKDDDVSDNKLSTYLHNLANQRSIDLDRNIKNLKKLKDHPYITDTSDAHKELQSKQEELAGIQASPEFANLKSNPDLKNKIDRLNSQILKAKNHIASRKEKLSDSTDYISKELHQHLENAKLSPDKLKEHISSISTLNSKLKDLYGKGATEENKEVIDELEKQFNEHSNVIASALSHKMRQADKDTVDENKRKAFIKEHQDILAQATGTAAPKRNEKVSLSEGWRKLAQKEGSKAAPARVLSSEEIANMPAATRGSIDALNRKVELQDKAKNESLSDEEMSELDSLDERIFQDERAKRRTEDSERYKTQRFENEFAQRKVADQGLNEYFKLLSTDPKAAKDKIKEVTNSLEVANANRARRIAEAKDQPSARRKEAEEVKEQMMSVSRAAFHATSNKRISEEDKQETLEDLHSTMKQLAEYRHQILGHLGTFNHDKGTWEKGGFKAYTSPLNEEEQGRKRLSALKQIADVSKDKQSLINYAVDRDERDKHSLYANLYDKLHNVPTKDSKGNATEPGLLANLRAYENHAKKKEESHTGTEESLKSLISEHKKVIDQKKSKIESVQDQIRRLKSPRNVEEHFKKIDEIKDKLESAKPEEKGALHNQLQRAKDNAHDAFVHNTRFLPTHEEKHAKRMESRSGKIAEKISFNQAHSRYPEVSEEVISLRKELNDARNSAQDTSHIESKLHDAESELSMLDKVRKRHANRAVKEAETKTRSEYAQEAASNLSNKVRMVEGNTDREKVKQSVSPFIRRKN